jgi:hypothetical protein
MQLRRVSTARPSHSVNAGSALWNDRAKLIIALDRPGVIHGWLTLAPLLGVGSKRCYLINGIERVWCALVLWHDGR